MPDPILPPTQDLDFPSQRRTKTPLLAILVFGAISLLLLLAAAIYSFFGESAFQVLPQEESSPLPVSSPAPPEEEQVFCTQDAKLCPDGSYVGRTGPNCEFAPCPGEE